MSARASSMPQWRASTSLNPRGGGFWGYRGHQPRQVKFEGHLEKRSRKPNGGWVRRFCVLNNGEFRYYAEEVLARREESDLPPSPPAVGTHGSERRGSAGPGSSCAPLGLEPRMVGAEGGGGRSRSSSDYSRSLFDDARATFYDGSPMTSAAVDAGSAGGGNRAGITDGGGSLSRTRPIDIGGSGRPFSIRAEMGGEERRMAGGDEKAEGAASTSRHRVIPLEHATAVRTVRREENAFMVVLPQEELVFRAASRELYQEWLFHFHSSILAVAMRIRNQRGDRHVGTGSGGKIEAGAWPLIATQSEELGAPDDLRSPSAHRQGVDDLDGAAMRRLPTREITIPPEKRLSLTGSLSRSPELGHGHGHEYYASEGHPLRRQPTISDAGGASSSSLLGLSFSSSSESLSTPAGAVGGDGGGGMSRNGISPSTSPRQQGAAYDAHLFPNVPDRASSYAGNSSLAASLMDRDHRGAYDRSASVAMPASALTPPRSTLSSGQRSSSGQNQSAGSSFDSMNSNPRSLSPSFSNEFSLKDVQSGAAGSSSLSGTSPRGGISSGVYLNNLAGRSSPGQRERRGSGSSAGSNLGGVFDLSLEENDFSMAAGASREAAESAAAAALSATTRMIDGVSLAVPLSPASPDSIASTGVAEGATRWRSGAYCARGVRAKNEDTYFISDDIARGGYSSSSPTDAVVISQNSRGDGGVHVNGFVSADGSWSRASGSGGGIRSLDGAQGAVIPETQGSPVATSPVLQQDCLGFFGVYDGHCGAECATMASDELHADIFSHEAFQSPEDANAASVAASASRAIHDAFLSFDARYLERAKRDSLYSGSTAVAAMVCEEGRKLIVANLGDSAAIVCRRIERGDGDGSGGGGPSGGTVYEAVEVTQSHKPDRPDEQVRVEAAGGWLTEERELFMGQLHRMDLDDPEIVSAAEDVVQWVTIARVCGELAVSRSFGDPDFKGFSPDSHAQAPEELFFPFPEGHNRSFTRDLVLAEPELLEHELKKGSDDFLVLASDGLWDVLNGQQVVDAIRRFQIRHERRDADAPRDVSETTPLNLEELAEDLTRLALRLGSADNITVVCVAFEYQE